VEVAFDLERGEVVGLTGLAGSGFESIPYLLCGAWPAQGGRLVLDGREIDLTALDPRRAVASGIALIPADRQRSGAVGSLSITDNVTLPRLPDFRRAGLLRRGAMHRDAGGLMSRFDVRPGEPRAEYGGLSGGNQQKSLLAKWLSASPRLVLFHEPTQGVDVGARQQIYATIRAAAEAGAYMLCASSDHGQLEQICDRVLVFGRGRITSELSGDDVTRERITERCYAGAVAPAVG
jgi:ribose transport system ATP-binding protein